MLAVVTQRARFPLMRSILDNKGGTSDTGKRIALMRRCMAIFGTTSVGMLLADRSFVGVACDRHLWSGCPRCPRSPPSGTPPEH
jgi:hypothetical protein